jgi:hypothetical protein
MKLQSHQNQIDLLVDNSFTNEEIQKLATAVLSKRPRSKRYYVGNASFIASKIVAVSIDNTDDALFGEEKIRLKVTYLS